MGEELRVLCGSRAESNICRCTLSKSLRFCALWILICHMGSGLRYLNFAGSEVDSRSTLWYNTSCMRNAGFYRNIHDIVKRMGTMVFSSLTFLFFFLPITLAVNMVLPKQARNYWLLLASLVFYAWGAHEFVLVMIISILMNYVFARLIDWSRSERFRKLCLFVTVVANLGILFYNKYMNFFTENLNRLFGDSVVVTEIVLPIGISFFTFQALSYVVDVYRKDTPVQKNPYYLGLYIAFFPQLIAGPIVRYRTIADQIEERTITVEKFESGVRRFCCGFAMKIFRFYNKCWGQVKHLAPNS
ncbi:MAG: hypothetical protein LUC35_05245 [Clostridiales bacterium]|nr:hypothetical protein [Clostridiales bacterium]